MKNYTEKIDQALQRQTPERINSEKLMKDQIRIERKTHERFFIIIKMKTRREIISFSTMQENACQRRCMLKNAVNLFCLALSFS